LPQSFTLEKNLLPLKTQKCIIYFRDKDKYLAELATTVWKSNSVYKPQVIPDAKFVVILFPINTNTKNLFCLMKTLQEKKIEVGIITVTCDIKLNWLKVISLLISDSIDKVPSTNIYSDKISLQNPSKYISKNKQFVDISIFSGHAGPADMKISRNFTLCGRAENSNSTKGNLVLPCWKGTHCPKQVLFNKDSLSKSGLKSIKLYAGRVNLLSGCNMAPLGTCLVSYEKSLVGQIQENGLQAIVSTTLITRNLQYELLFLALLNDGYTLGQSTYIINQSRVDESKDVKQSSSHPGAFLLLGNPALKYQKNSVNYHEKSIASKCLPSSYNHIKTIKFKYIPSNNIFGLPKINPILPISCSFTEKSQRTVYLFSSDRQAINHKLVQFSHTSTATIVKLVLQSFLKNSSFWDIWGKYFKLVSGTSNSSTELFSQLLTEISNQQKLFTHLIYKLNNLLSFNDIELLTFIETANDNLRSIQTLAIESVSNVIANYGSLLFKGWKHMYLKKRVYQSIDYCACGNFPITIFEYYSLINPVLKRNVYECFGCGVVGESGIEKNIKVNNIPEFCTKNSIITTSFDIQSSIKTPLLITAMLIIDPWVKDTKIVTKTHTDFFIEDTQLEITLLIPEDIYQGNHILNAIIILNGTLIQFRRILQVGQQQK
jgi:hypothetical protein